MKTFTPELAMAMRREPAETAGAAVVVPLPPCKNLRSCSGRVMAIFNFPVVLIGIYVLIVSCVCFGLFAWDKYCAIRGFWRVREAQLLLIAILGGSPGALAAQRLLRHKTRKEPFRSVLRRIAVFQIAAAAVAFIPPLRDGAVGLAAMALNTLNTPPH